MGYQDPTTASSTDYTYYASLSADVNCVTARPGYAHDQKHEKLPRKLVVDSGGDGNLTIVDRFGHSLTIAIVAPWSMEIGPASITQATTTVTKLWILW